ncbi:CBS domain-containing protein [Ensifer soli]|uniref:CBS domain-containing protein n=1 Tax=Ciceribacter sp. sgz301302 TaxID=3342379 RepID=UPI0035BA5414
MSAQVYSISPTDSAQSAARLMAAANVGVLPVETPGVGTVVGIVTDRDIMAAITAKGLPTTTAIYEFMTVCAETCDETDTVQAVVEKMLSLQLRRLVVMNAERRIAGIIALADIAAVDPSVSARLPEAPQDVSRRPYAAGARR